MNGGTGVETDVDTGGRRVISAATPIMHNGNRRGVIALTSPTGEVDALAAASRNGFCRCLWSRCWFRSV